MTEFSFQYTGEEYNKRRKASLARVTAISIIVGLFVAVVNGLMWGIILGAVLFLVQFLKSDRWDKTFINKIKFQDNIVTIEYKLREQTRSLQGSVLTFDFKKKIAFNRTKTAYLAVYQNGDLKIRQFEVGDWTERRMDEVISDVRSKKQTHPD